VPSIESPRRLEAVVHGLVQGVGFRMFVFDTAIELGLDGWVANEPDGAVRVVAEGPDRVLGRLLARLRAGPPAARVDSVSEAWSAASGTFTGFSVRSGWHMGD
jgi:acylphosphatase